MTKVDDRGSDEVPVPEEPKPSGASTSSLATTSAVEQDARFQADLRDRVRDVQPQLVCPDQARTSAVRPPAGSRRRPRRSSQRRLARSRGHGGRGVGSRCDRARPTGSALDAAERRPPGPPGRSSSRRAAALGGRSRYDRERRRHTRRRSLGDPAQRTEVGATDPSWRHRAHPGGHPATAEDPRRPPVGGGGEAGAWTDEIRQRDRGSSWSTAASAHDRAVGMIMTGELPARRGSASRSEGLLGRPREMSEDRGDRLRSGNGANRDRSRA